MLTRAVAAPSASINTRKKLPVQLPANLNSFFSRAMSLITWAQSLPSDMAIVNTMPGMTIMTLLAAKNNLDAIFMILTRMDEKKHASLVNTPDAYGNTPLHYFALSNNEPALKALVGVGASMKHQNHAAETPWDVHESKSLDMVE